LTEPARLSQTGEVDKRESLFVKLTSAFGSQLGLLMFGMVAQFLLARFLGPAGKGTFSLTIALANTLTILAHFSLSSANSHFAGRYPDDRRAMVGNSIFIAFIWGAIVTALVVYVKGKVPEAYLPRISERMWGMALVAVIPLLLFEFGNGLVLGLNWIKRLSVVLPLKEALFLAGILWLAMDGILSIESAVAVWVSAVVIVALLQIFSAWWRVGWAITVSPKLLAKMALFSVQSHTANVFTFLRSRFDWFLIDHFLTPSDLGYYTIAGMLVYVLWYLPIAIAQVLIPHISSRDDAAGNELTPLLARLGFSLALIGAVMLGIFGLPLIILLPGRQFVPAYPALLLLLPGGVVMSLARILAGDLIGRGLPKYSMVISVVAFILNVAVNLVFIPRFGILGAAATASITHIFAGLLYIYFFIRVSGVPLGELLILRREDLKGLKRILRRAS